MEAPLKTKSRATIWSHNPIAGQMSRGKHDPKRYMHPSVHCSTVYNTWKYVKVWKQPKCPLTEE